MYDYNNECDCDFGTVPFWFDNDTPAYYRIIPQYDDIPIKENKAPEYDLTGEFALKMNDIYSDALLRVSKWSAEYDKLRTLREYYSNRARTHRK